MNLIKIYFSSYVMKNTSLYGIDKRVESNKKWQFWNKRILNTLPLQVSNFVSIIKFHYKLFAQVCACSNLFVVFFQNFALNDKEDVIKIGRYKSFAGFSSAINILWYFSILCK